MNEALMQKVSSAQAAALQPAADGLAAPKRKGKGPVGPVLGKGTAVVRAMIDAAAAGASEGAAVAEIADRQVPKTDAPALAVLYLWPRCS